MFILDANIPHLLRAPPWGLTEAILLPQISASKQLRKALHCATEFRAPAHTVGGGTTASLIQRPVGAVPQVHALRRAAP
jgi:hypothetical protein